MTEDQAQMLIILLQQLVSELGNIRSSLGTIATRMH
jgi:hypothetical protein